MLSIFRPLIERVKVLFAVSAAQELEADLLLREAERRAELLRQAERYDAEGLHGIAQHLRQQAEQVSVQRPLAGMLPAVAHLQLGLADTYGASAANSWILPSDGYSKAKAAVQTALSIDPKLVQHVT